jgi:quercetin dioxygenase-like cupin family protein/ribosome-associated toxin RatA of RatAB toxin-antitoxin module
MTGHTDNEIRIDAPLDFVWRVTNEVRDWPRLFTEYASVEVIEEEPGRIVFRLTTHPDEDGNVYSWVSERCPDPATHTVQSRRIETGPFEYMRLRWTYTAEPDPGTACTRLRWIQDFAVKPTAPADDAGFEDYLNRNTAVQLKAIKAHVRSIADVPANLRRGGEIRTILSPGTVGSGAGFLGALRLDPGERINEHYHPYSEEFLFVTDGVATVSLDGLDQVVHADEGIWIPKNIRHRVSNERDTPVRAVFQLAPLAPRPELGHVDTEPQPGEPVAGEGTQWTTGAGRSDSEPVATLAGEG